MRKNKKGISPLIATVLLIGFTIVLAALVMRWGGTLFRETTQTTGCESQGRIACSSQVDISVGTIDCAGVDGAGVLNCDSINSLIVNNVGATLTLDGFNVQRELSDGSIENKLVTFTLTPGASNNVIVTPPPPIPDYVFSNLALAALHVTPTFTQTTTDGGSCKIVCSEQKERIPAGDPRIV